jgi:hypothetical protein
MELRWAIYFIYMVRSYQFHILQLHRPPFLQLFERSEECLRGLLWHLPFAQVARIFNELLGLFETGNAIREQLR